MVTVNLEQQARELLPELPPMAMTIAGDGPDAGHWYRAEQMRDYAARAIVSALRQQPAPVDLGQFRLPVEAWKSHLDPNDDDDESEAYDEADRLLALINNAGKVEPPLADETGPYPFGAGIEPNPKARYWQQRSAFWMAEALRLGYAPPGETPTHQPAPVVDDAMVERYLAAQAKAVHEIYDACGNGGKTAAHLHPVREACRVGLTAALSRTHDVDTTGVLRGNADLVPAEHTYLTTRPENNHESY